MIGSSYKNSNGLKLKYEYTTQQSLQAIQSQQFGMIVNNVSGVLLSDYMHDTEGLKKILSSKNIIDSMKKGS